MIAVSLADDSGYVVDAFFGLASPMEKKPIRPRTTHLIVTPISGREVSRIDYAQDDLLSLREVIELRPFETRMQPLVILEWVCDLAVISVLSLRERKSLCARTNLFAFPGFRWRLKSPPRVMPASIFSPSGRGLR